MESIPAEARRFLDENVESVDQLEILRILTEDAGREWDIAGLGKQIQAAADVTVAHLAALHAKGLVATEVREGAMVCRFGPRTPELEVQVRQLLDIYRQRPVTMIRLVYERAGERLRAFVDAFKLRKEE